MPRWQTQVDYVLVLLLVLLIQAIAFATQQPIARNGGLGWDGVNYHRTAVQLASGERPAGPERFARRIGTPALAALVPGRNAVAAFRLVNAAASLVSTLLLFAWLRRFHVGRWTAIALTAVYASHWLQLVRFTAFYPVLVDACAQVFCFAGLHVLASYERQPAPRHVVALSVISAVGVCFREIVLIVPLAFLCARNPAVRRISTFPWARLVNMPRREQWIPLAHAVAALAIVDALVVTTDPAFDASGHLIGRALSRTGVTWLLGWLVAFGPCLLLVGLDWRNAAAFLGRHRWLLAWVLLIGIIGWAGSLESERHAINWAAPAVFVLTAMAIQHHPSWLRQRSAMALLVGAQLIVNRVFWSVPQVSEEAVERVPTLLLTPVGANASYLYLFPDYLPRGMALLQLLQHAVVMLAGLWLLRRGESAATCRWTPVLTDNRPEQNRWRVVVSYRQVQAGLRRLGVAKSLTVMAGAFAAFAAVTGAIILVGQPAPVRVHVRWAPHVDAPRRAALEREWDLTTLQHTEGRTWSYLLGDASTDRIRAIVTHPDVEDTGYLNRRWYRPELASDPPRLAILYGGIVGAAGAVAALLWTAFRLGDAARAGA